MPNCVITGNFKDPGRDGLGSDDKLLSVTAIPILKSVIPIDDDDTVFPIEESTTGSVEGVWSLELVPTTEYTPHSGYLFKFRYSGKLVTHLATVPDEATANWNDIMEDINSEDIPQSITLFYERLKEMLAEGSNVTFTYDDDLRTITIRSSGGNGNGDGVDQTARDAAEAAQTDADAAQTTADAAQTTANSAASDVLDAQDTADNAQTTADSASTAASAAQADADTAQGEIDTHEGTTHLVNSDVNTLIYNALAAALSENTETNITVTYNTDDNTIDFVVPASQSGLAADDVEEYAKTGTADKVPASRIVDAIVNGVLVFPESDGTLPSAEDNQGRVGIAGNHFQLSVNQGGHDKVVTFLEYSPTRTEPPARSGNENNYGGSFAQPPHSTIGNYAVNTILWDRGSQVWLIKSSSSATRWSTYSGPLNYHHGNLWTTEAEAARHISSASGIGRVVVIGHGANQKPYVVTAFTAPTDDEWVWLLLGLDIGDVSGIVQSFIDDLKDGTIFTGDVSGITPTEDAHFTRKDYVDGKVGDAEELWSGNIAVATANTWVAAGTDVVPDTAKWILFNGGKLTSDVDDVPPGDWKWINAHDWRTKILAASAGDSLADGTGMFFTEWVGNDIETSGFARRDVVFGRTSTNTPLVTSKDAGEDFHGASIRYVTALSTGDGGVANGDGDITSVTAGIGLTGGGISGDVELDIDTSETDFPTIPVAKGGTGATTAAAARTALGAGTLTIAAYSATATYVRGSANSIVTFDNHVWVYRSTQRNTNHSPADHPEYWWKLDTPIRVLDHDSTTSTNWRSGEFFLTETGQLRICTATISASPASIIADHTGADQEFLWLNEPAGNDGTGLTVVTSDATLTGTGQASSILKVANPFTDDDETKLEGIESGAEVNVGVEYTQTEKTKLGGIASGAEVNIGVEYTQTEKTKLFGIESSAKDDQTGDEIVSLIEAETGNDRLSYDHLKDTPTIPSANNDNPEDVAATADDGSASELSKRDHVHRVPTDNTLEFDGSGDLGVQIHTVTELLSEDIRYYSDDTTREDAHQASKGIVFLDTSRFAKKIHSVEWDFEGDGISNNYATFFVGIDSDDDISHVYGISDELFNVTTSGTRRFSFGSEGLRIPGGVTRLGLFLTRTGSPGDENHETKVYRGQPADDSPRESYPSASLDFPFWRSARFNSSRPEIGEHINNYITNGEIYGYPKIRYTIEVEHTPFVGDDSVSVSHLNSGSADDGTVATADGSGGVAFEELPEGLTESEVDGRVTAGVADFAETDNTDDIPLSKIPGGVTHVESGATYNNNVISVSTAETVRGGDGILFAVPSPFGTSATQEVSLEIDGQSSSEFPLHDRNGDVLHEADLTVNSVYIAISDASSWDILVLPTGAPVADNRLIPAGGTDGQVLTKASSTDYNADWESVAGGVGDSGGIVILTPQTAADKNFSQTTGLGNGQNNELFDTDITLPTGLTDNELFYLRANANIGEALIGLTKAHLEELTAVQAVTWSNTASNGVDADRSGDDRNAYSFPIGQNRGLLIGISNETPYRLQWGATNTGAIIDFQIIVVTAGSDRPGSEENDNSITGAFANQFIITDIDSPSGTWGFINPGDIGGQRVGSWDRFLIEDLTSLTDVVAGAVPTDANALMFSIDGVDVYFVGQTSGDKIAVAASDSDKLPDNLRVRTN